jgi:hypothetical protein
MATTKPVLFLALAGSLLAVVLAESLGTPRYAGPDERSHVVRGAALVRGELFGERPTDWLAEHGGEDLPVGATDIAQANPDSAAVAVFDVPRWLTQPDDVCFRGQPGVSASCATVVETAGSGVLSTAATYPVWAYLLPGVATLVVDSPRVVWLARALSALVPVALVAATLARLVADNRRAAGASMLLAMTPMVVFVFAVVNPSGLAVAGAMTVWITADDTLRTGKSSWLFPAGLAALVLPRDDGLLWAALVIVVVAVVWRRTPLTLWRSASVIERAVIVAVSCAGAMWALVVGRDVVPIGSPASDLLQSVVTSTGIRLRQAVGIVGWLDTSIPETAFALWWLGVGTVAMIPLVSGQRRRIVGSALSLALFVVTGWVIEYVRAGSVGMFWQGRYALPMLVGVVLVAGLSPGADLRIGRLAAIAPGVVAVVVWNLSFLQQLRRWGVGENGSIRPWEWATPASPVPVIPLIIVHLAGSISVLWLVQRASVAGRAHSLEAMASADGKDARVPGHQSAATVGTDRLRSGV